MPNSFKVFNESLTNIESDAQYLADQQRIDGVVPGKASSFLHNKLFRQVSIMAAALGQVTANRGYNASDADLAALITALSSALSPFATSANVTYYVDPAGSDSNNGLSAGAAGAFKTINKAISMIPQIVNHAVTINAAAGAYPEGIYIEGFSGKGSITIIGGASLATSVNFSVFYFAVNNCPLPITIQGFIGISTSGNTFGTSNSAKVLFKYCTCNAVTASYGMFIFDTSYGTVNSCSCSNRSTALTIVNGGIVNSENWTVGAGNTTGLQCGGGKIAKNGTQPQGTTAENAYFGGQIL